MIPSDKKAMAANLARTALADALTNPATAEMAQKAGDRLMKVQETAVGQSSSAMTHYAWGAGLGTVSVLNFYCAYRLPPEDKWLRAYLMLTGVAAGAGAYVNVTRARAQR